MDEKRSLNPDEFSKESLERVYFSLFKLDDETELPPDPRSPEQIAAAHKAIQERCQPELDKIKRKWLRRVWIRRSVLAGALLVISGVSYYFLSSFKPNPIPVEPIVPVPLIQNVPALPVGPTAPGGPSTAEAIVVVQTQKKTDSLTLSDAGRYRLEKQIDVQVGTREAIGIFSNDSDNQLRIRVGAKSLKGLVRISDTVEVSSTAKRFFSCVIVYSGTEENLQILNSLPVLLTSEEVNFLLDASEKRDSSMIRDLLHRVLTERNISGTWTGSPEEIIPIFSK